MVPDRIRTNRNQSVFGGFVSRTYMCLRGLNASQKFVPIAPCYRFVTDGNTAQIIESLHISVNWGTIISNITIQLRIQNSTCLELIDPGRSGSALP